MAALAFSRVTFAGLVLNFVAIPMMSVAQIAGMVTVPVAYAVAARGGRVRLSSRTSAPGGSCAAPRSWTPCPGSPTGCRRRSWLAMACYYAGWAAWLRGPPAVRPRRPGRAMAHGSREGPACGAIVVSGLWILVEPVSLLAPGVRGHLRLTVIDVAHGDSLLVQLPDRRSLLIDTGGSLSGSRFDIGGRIVAPVLWAQKHAQAGRARAHARRPGPRRRRRLDLPGLSTPRDLGGRDGAEPRGHRPAQGAWPPRRASCGCGGAPARRCAMGEVRLRIWHPPPPDWERRKVRNDDSMVIELRYRDVSIVLTGDIGQEVERRWRRAFAPAAIRVMKVPHHGSATSSSAEFVAALKPRVALLSAGQTTRVSEEVLRRYHDVGAALYRTDVHGAITIDTDGRQVTVTTFTGERAVFREVAAAQEGRDRISGQPITVTCAPLPATERPSSRTDPLPAAPTPSSDRDPRSAARRLVLLDPSPTPLPSAPVPPRASDSPRAAKRRSSSVNRFANLSSDRLSAASGSTPSLRERLARAKSRSPISSSTCRRAARAASGIARP